MGEFGRFDWLGNLHLIVIYNVWFEVATAVCLMKKLTAAVREALFERFKKPWKKLKSLVWHHLLSFVFIVNKIYEKLEVWCLNQMYVMMHAWIVEMHLALDLTFYFCLNLASNLTFQANWTIDSQRSGNMDLKIAGWQRIERMFLLIFSFLSIWQYTKWWLMHRNVEHSFQAALSS